MTKKVCIIGGGASGLVAAITAATDGAFVTILEHKDKIGKKILATGNGKCNYTNLIITPECYNTYPDSFEMKALSNFGPEDTVEFFKNLGIEPLIKDNYIYPNSEQASSILEALKYKAENLKILIKTDVTILNISYNGYFIIKTNDSEIKADSLILATGSKASPITGSDGSGYTYAKNFGHKIIRPLPALCALYAKDNDFFKICNGVRVKSNITIICNDVITSQNLGELQLAEYGISGIPTFQISRYASRALDKAMKVEAEINFLPGIDDLHKYIKNRIDHVFTPNTSLESLGNGLLNKKLWLALLNKSHLNPHSLLKNTSNTAVDILVSNIGGARFNIFKTAGFDKAQVCTGGVATKELSSHTFESKIVPNLYVVGELVDVDGICGGYNLQWAWTSGILAGRQAGK